MRRRSIESIGRTAALISIGAFAVHQLRYLAGYGHGAGSELSRQGHGYLAGALPVLAAFLLSAIAAGMLRAALGRRARPRLESASRAPDTLRNRSILFAAAILAVFCCQESLEGVLSAGHPGGLAAILAGGGWTALPLAAALGALCALLDRGVATLEEAISGARPAIGLARCRAPRPLAPARLAEVPLAASPLAFGISRRPPPGGLLPGTW